MPPDTHPPRLTVDLLSPDQAEALVKLQANIRAGKRVSVLVGCAGCLSGDSEIIVNRAGKAFRLNISEVVRRFNGGVAGGRTWSEDIPTTVQGLGRDGLGRRHRLAAAYESGIRQTYKLTTDSGHSLSGTKDHLFMVRDETFMPMGELRCGDEVIRLIRPLKTGIAKRIKYRVIEMAAHPFAARSTFKSVRIKGDPKLRQKAQNRVQYHRVVKEAELSGLSFEEFVRRVRDMEHDGLVFLDPSENHVHHKDGDSTNNLLSNLEVLLIGDHHRLHDHKDHVLWRPMSTKVVSIVDDGEVPTFDLSIEDPDPHNYTANGFIVHNTGKTTLMRVFAEKMTEDGWFVFWAAPTGKAAARQAEVTGQPASTIHSLVYTRVMEGSKGQPLFSKRRESLLEGRPGLCVVDEASMLGKRVYDDLIAAAGSLVSILFVGDREQLPPVADALGPDLDNPTAELTTVHRQALESPILAVATEVRAGKPMRKGKIGTQYERRPGSVFEAATWIADRIRASSDAVVLCATNELRRNTNKLTRRELGFSGPLCAGEQLVVLLNNRQAGKMNGETIRVDEVSIVPGLDGEDSGLLRIFSGGEVYFVHGKSIGAEMTDFKRACARLGQLRNPSQWLHVDYGYALTIHKSQASEFREVCLLVDGKLKWRQSIDPIGVRRMAYTAITRAKEFLLVLDV